MITEQMVDDYLKCGLVAHEQSKVVRDLTDDELILFQQTIVYSEMYGLGYSADDIADVETYLFNIEE